MKNKTSIKEQNGFRQWRRNQAVRNAASMKRIRQSHSHLYRIKYETWKKDHVLPNMKSIARKNARIARAKHIAESQCAAYFMP